MKTFFIILVVFFPFSSFLYSQNVMWLDTTQTTTGQSFTVSVKVNNINKFVAFQFDVQFPSEATYNVNSTVLTTRANGHQLVVSQIGGGLYRFVAFSMSQGHFSGNTGAVITLTCTAGNLPGTYPFILSNPILADSNNTNILNSYNNGQVSIQLPTNIKEDTKDESSGINIYPNPFNSSIKFKINNSSSYGEIRIFDVSGKLINVLSIRENAELWNGTDSGGNPITSGIYFAAFEGNKNKTIRKIIYLK